MSQNAYNHFMAAAQTLGVQSEAREDVLAIATKQPGAAFSDILIPPINAVDPAPMCSTEEGNRHRATDMDKMKPNESLSGRPIAKKIVAKMKLHWQRKIVNIKNVIAGQGHGGERLLRRQS